MVGNVPRAILVIHVDLHILVICHVLRHHLAVGTLARAGIQHTANAVADEVPEVILGSEYGECVSVCVSVRVESVRVAVEKSTASV